MLYLMLDLVLAVVRVAGAVAKALIALQDLRSNLLDVCFFHYITRM